MWIETAAADTAHRVVLRCDECGILFDGRPVQDRKASWHRASIAGWARTARAPDRHVCADC